MSSTVGRQQEAAPSFTDTVHRLSTAQKSSIGVSVYSRWINRPIGRYFAAAAFKVGMTPNQVTAISAALTAAGIVLLATVPAAVGTGVAVSVLLALGYAVDSADGQLARLRGGGTLAGEWLDHVVDSVKMASLHGAVLIGWYRYFDLTTDALLMVPLAFAAESSVFFFALILSEQLRRRATGDRSRRTPTSQRRLRQLQSLAVLPAEYGLQCWMFVLWGVPAVFVPVYVSLAALNVALLAVGQVRWFREMRRLAPAAPESADAPGESR
jgi:phosphatidylglycerophosphate synthase